MGGACAQAPPQSCRNGPTPRMPLAPNVTTVFSAAPGQSPGTVQPVAPITCTLMPATVFPDVGSVMSARATGPKDEPSANCRHSAIGSPPALISEGRLSVNGESADAST